MVPFQETSQGEKILYAMAAQKGIPLHGSFELTPLCNMNCKMCFVRLSKDELSRRGKLLTLDQWLGIAEQIKEAGTLFLLLTGGEPLLYPDFKELYLKLRSMGFVLMLNTNATLINAEWANFFAKYPPRRINITLYGANSNDYANVCNNPAGFDCALNGIRLLKDRSVPVKLSGSLLRSNLKTLEEYLSVCEELELPVMTETYMMPACRERFKPFPFEERLTPEEFAQAKLRLMRTIQSEEYIEEDIKNIVSEFEQNKKTAGDPTGFACKATKCSFAINWQGHMRPCVLLRNPEIDVLEKGFIPAWNYIKTTCSSVQRDSKCVSCEYRSICSVCPAAEQAENGCFGKAPEYLCECISEFAKRLKEYIQQQE